MGCGCKNCSSEDHERHQLKESLYSEFAQHTVSPLPRRNQPINMGAVKVRPTGNRTPLILSTLKIRY
jgi:hypothetical protein